MSEKYGVQRSDRHESAHRQLDGKNSCHRLRVVQKNGKNHILVDLPGTYSLFTHSVEEEVARDFILSENADACIVVCDATCLERNLNLVLQIIEITPRTVVCINLMDEAKRKKISVDIPALSRELGVPVIGTSARSGKGLDELIDAVDSVISKSPLP